MALKEVSIDNKELITSVTRLLSQDRVEEAIKLAEKVLRQDESNIDAWVCLGSALKKCKEYERAYGCFHRAADFDPDSEKAWFGRALCKALLDDLDNAMDCVTKLLLLAPQDQKGKALERSLRMRLDMRDRTKAQPKGPEKSVPTSHHYSRTLVQKIVDHLDDDKNNMLIVVPNLFCLKASLTVLQTLTTSYHMDGVMISSVHDPRIITKAMSKLSNDLKNIQFLELSPESKPTSSSEDNILSCPIFDLVGLIESIDEGLRLGASKHATEDHFVLFDDLSALSYYHDPRSIRKFLNALREHLNDIDVVQIMIISQEKMGFLSKWPEIVFRSKINVKPSWFRPQGVGL